MLREYLDFEFRDLQLPFGYDFEKIIDDFVFLLFFVGNDFLPHLPSLEIRDGAIDLIMYLYKEILPNLEGYLTEQGRVMFERVEIIFHKLAKIEGDFFVRKQDRNQREKERRNRNQNQNSHVSFNAGGQAAQRN